MATCLRCGGTGTYQDLPCSLCGGTGVATGVHESIESVVVSILDKVTAIETLMEEHPWWE